MGNIPEHTMLMLAILTLKAYSFMKLKEADWYEKSTDNSIFIALSYYYS